MTDQDFDEFAAVLQATAELYPQRTLSPAALALYWSALKDLALPEVRAGIGAHINNPDVGQFMPKPADVRRSLSGTTQDAAMMAWSKVVRAAKSVGAYTTVVFDDPYIHATLSDMGGWVTFCRGNEDDLPFREKEFVAKYRAYRAKPASELAFVKKLTGIIDQENGSRGYAPEPVALIGKPDRAQRVLEAGSARNWLKVAYVAQEGVKPLPEPRLGLLPVKPKAGEMSAEDTAAKQAAEAEIAARAA